MLDHAPTPTGRQTTVLGDPAHMFRGDQLCMQLDAIFPDRTFQEFARQTIESLDQIITSYGDFADRLNDVLRGVMRDPNQLPGCDIFAQMEALLAYKQTVSANLDYFAKGSKPNPDAVFWPTKPGSIYETIPYAQKLGLITKETPVGSAGSCFATAIAHNLQERGFNYVVTENEMDDLAAGVVIDGVSPDNPPARFSANWGILFNTPSFRQLAEKAFGERDLPKIVVPSTINYHGERIQVFYDPYREGVTFLSREAYEQNYDKHIDAAREAFLRSDFFIVTLGLNECWEFTPDGTILSRNPRQLAMHTMIRRRILTVEENIENIQRLIDVVRAHKPDFKLIISVSPVPFLATTRAKESHVITANVHSKAVLRVAAEELVNRNRNVFYFPSYEQVTVCTKEPFWHEDQRHISDEGVAGVMRLFDTVFVAGN